MSPQEPVDEIAHADDKQHAGQRDNDNNDDTGDDNDKENVVTAFVAGSIAINVIGVLCCCYCCSSQFFDWKFPAIDG